MVVKITKFLNSTDIISIQFLPNHNSLYPSYIRNYLSGQIILRKNVYKMFSADNLSKCSPPAEFTYTCHSRSTWINSPRIQASAGENLTYIDFIQMFSQFHLYWYPFLYVLYHFSFDISCILQYVPLCVCIYPCKMFLLTQA